MRKKDCLSDMPIREWPRTKDEALARGLPRYFPGHLCKNNHISRHYASNGECCECNIESRMIRYYKNRKLKARKRKGKKTKT